MKLIKQNILLIILPFLSLSINAMINEYAFDAVKEGNYAELALYLDLGGNPNAQYCNKKEYKCSLLHVAAIYFRDNFPTSPYPGYSACISTISHYPINTSSLRCIFEMCKVTRPKKTDINAKDSAGNTALHILVARGQQQHFMLRENTTKTALERALITLLRCGASCEIKNNQGKTPLMLAQDYLESTKKTIFSEKKIISNNMLKQAFSNISYLESNQRDLENIIKILRETKSHQIDNNEKETLIDF